MMTLSIGILGMASFGVTTALVYTLVGFNFTRFMTAFFSTAVFQTTYILGKFFSPSVINVNEYLFIRGQT